MDEMRDMADEVVEMDADREMEEARARAEMAERMLKAVEMGVPVGRAERYVKVAQTFLEEGVGFDEALGEALREFPLRRRDGGPRVVASARGDVAQKRWKDMALGERAELYKKDAELARRMAAECGERL